MSDNNAPIDNNQQAKISKEQIHRELWYRGILKWKLHRVQIEMYNLFYGAEKQSTLVWLVSRQTGKSFLLTVLALEHALRKEHSIIKLVTDTKSHVKSIFEKLFIEIMADMPDDIRPKYIPSEFTYYFPNGSQIQMAGTDNKNYQRLRGQKAVLVLVDEAGFCSDLEDAVSSVLFPTTTHTGGKIVLATTPPEDPDHEFIKFKEEAEMRGLLTVKTIDDNPLLSDEVKANIEKKMGGRNSIRFRREYLCELIHDSSRSVIPEFTADIEAKIVREHPTPPHFDNYVAMDLGGKDLTVLLFAYYDFKNDLIIIQDEIVLDFTQENVTLKVLTEKTLEKEKELWTNIYTNELRVPVKRVSDIDYIALKEIAILSENRLIFTPTKKDNKAAAINNLRTLIANEKIIINPKCKTLIRHLKNVKWKSENNKETFARSPDNGHYDGADCCIYLVRNIDFSRNPYPAGYGLNLKEGSAYYPNGKREFEQKNNLNIEVYKKIFNIKRK